MMMPNTLKLRPSDILWTQSSIKNSFVDGRLIGETLDQLCRGTCQIEDIRRIRVFRQYHRWWSLDNRRLWVFREFERLGGCAEIVVMVVTPTLENLDKYTTTTFGSTIRIRGRWPGGRWYLKPNRTLAKENYNYNLAPSTRNTGEHWRSIGERTSLGVKDSNTAIYKHRWWSLDNRRLWVFREFERLGGCAEIVVMVVTPTLENLDKYTTTTFDSTIRIRGRWPGGRWNLKPNRTLAKENYNYNLAPSTTNTGEHWRSIGERTSLHLHDLSTDTNNVRRSQRGNVSTFSANNTTGRPDVIRSQDSSNASTTWRSTLSDIYSYFRNSGDSSRADGHSATEQTNVPSSTSQSAIPIVTDGRQRADFFPGTNAGVAAQASNLEESETGYERKWRCAIS